MADERDNPWAEPDDSETERSGPEDWRRQEEPEAEPEGTDEPDSSGDEEEAGEPDLSDEPEASGDEEELGEADHSDEPEASSGELAGEAAAGPSMGPHTDLRAFQEGREESLERAAHASDTDAMGREKRRQIVGGTYGMTRGKLAVLYATVVALIAGAAFGAYLLAKDLDQPPEKIEAEAPWAEQDAPQRAPNRIQ